jgi:Fe-S-cluster containining protein
MIGLNVIVEKQLMEDIICIYLDDDLNCNVYDSKPDQCSAFPWWNENLKNEKTWNKTKNICPGIEHPEALIIDKNTIKFWVEADEIAEKGVRDFDLVE